MEKKRGGITLEYAIQTERLSKSFGGRRVLRDINLQVPKGSIFGFIGPNGAGKTTTIRLLLGLIKPDAGSSSVLGLDSFQQSIEIRKRVGYLSEHNQFYPWMRVEELIKFNAGFFPTWDHGRAEQLLQMFDLHPGARIKELSKGMRTQLGLVISLAHNPELLILDEPTSGLDPVWRRQFLQIMAREAASRRPPYFSLPISSPTWSGLPTGWPLSWKAASRRYAPWTTLNTTNERSGLFFRERRRNRCWARRGSSPSNARAAAT